MSSTPVIQPKPLTVRERTRRIGLICCHCLRNIAYYRAGWDRKSPNQPRVPRGFWINATSNSLDIAVLEWCKLFADPGSKHRWEHVIHSNRTEFLNGLHDRIGMDRPTFEAYKKRVVRYRDKFVAHLDNDRVMNLPTVRGMRSSAGYLFDVLKTDANLGQYLNDSPASAREYYATVFRHARDEHTRALKP